MSLDIDLTLLSTALMESIPEWESGFSPIGLADIPRDDFVTCFLEQVSCDCLSQYLLSSGNANGFSYWCEIG